MPQYFNTLTEELLKGRGASVKNASKTAFLRQHF